MGTDTISLREKMTADIEMQLLSGTTPIDLTGIDHIEMEMKDSKRKIYRYSSSDSPAYVSITNATSGIVKFTPPTDKIFLSTNSPYRGYWRVYETATQSYTVPEDGEFTIKIRQDF